MNPEWANQLLQRVFMPRGRFSLILKPSNGELCNPLQQKYRFVH